jgi:hypothetical protein
MLAAALSMGTTCNGNQDYLISPESTSIDLSFAGVQNINIEHDQSYNSRNTLDFVITNTGESEMVLGMSAKSTRTATNEEFDAGCNEDEDAGDEAAGDTGQGADIIFDFDATPNGGLTPDRPDPLDGLDDIINCFSTAGQISLNVAPGQQAIGRFTEQQLTTGVVVSVLIQCRSERCQGTLDYALLQAQLECLNDGNCAADETCQQELGICVSNAESCQAVPTSKERGLGLGLLGLALLCIFLLTRLRGGRSVVLLLVVGLGISLSSAEAQAQRLDFDKASAQTALGFGLRSWTGVLAQDTRPGMTLDWSQSIQYRHLGAHISIGTAFFLTDQAPPPSTKGMQTYSLRIGPRAQFAWRSFRFYGDLEYERLGVISNALVRTTGQALSFNAAGVAAGVRWHYGPLLLGLRTSFTQVIEFDAGMVGISFDLGVAGQL